MPNNFIRRFIIFHCIKRTPEILFHFTHKSNITSITSDRCIKHGTEDNYTWYFEDFDNAVQYFEKFMMSDDHHYFDKNGIRHHAPRVDKSNYVILKFKPTYNKPLEWFYYEASIPPHIPIEKVSNPFENSVAHKGNLKIKNIEVLPIP